MHRKTGYFRKFVAAAAVALYVVSAFARPACAAGEKVVFAISMPPSLLGDGAADIISYFNKLKKGVLQKTGYELKIEPLANWDAVVSALRRGKADVAWMPTFEYARIAAHQKSPVIQPLVTASINGSTKSVTCMYVKKNSGLKDFDKLVNKRIAFADQSSWTLVNTIFESRKYPFSPFDLFGTHEELTRESQAYALHLDQVDVIVLEPSYIPFIEKNIPGFRNEITSLACTKPLTNTLIVYRSNMPRDMHKNLLSLLARMHTDPAFTDIMSFFKTGNAKWVESSPGMYSDWVAIYTRAAKKGWLAQYGKVRHGKSE